MRIDNSQSLGGKAPAADQDGALRAALAQLRTNVRVLSVGKAIEIYKEVGLPGEVMARFGIDQMTGIHGIGHTRIAMENAMTTPGEPVYETWIFERDGMASIPGLFANASADEAAGRPDPTQMNVGECSLLGVLRWYKSHLNQYSMFRLSGGDVDFEEEENETVEGFDVDDEVGAVGVSGLEADLQAALRENIEQLKPGLTICDGGAERKVASGFLDILARDGLGRLEVIELKAGTARDAVIAQILGYMGDLTGQASKPARSIIVAADFRTRVQSSARAISDLALKSYRYRFEFR